MQYIKRKNSKILSIFFEAGARLLYHFDQE